MWAWGAGYHTQNSSDFRWVYVVWPRPFICICHRGVAAIAASVHLMDLNLGRKGGAWPHRKQHHPVPQWPPFSSSDWPPEVHRQSHLNHTASTNNCLTAVLPHHPHKSSPHFLWGRSNTTPLQPYPHRRLPSGPTVPVYTASLTDMPSLSTAHGSIWRYSKVTLCRRHAHPSPKPSRLLRWQSTGS
jgi:hypothetical protein